MNVSHFIKSVPPLTKTHLPSALKGFKQTALPWLVQLYYDDKMLHYELAKLPDKYGANRLEIGMHFESRDHRLNNVLLTGFDHYLLEIRASLGEDWWAEPWVRGWTKVYTTLHYQTLDEPFMEETALHLAKTISVIHPLYTRLRTIQKG